MRAVALFVIGPPVTVVVVLTLNVFGVGTLVMINEFDVKLVKPFIAI
jgi:hypothetical protein